MYKLASTAPLSCLSDWLDAQIRLPLADAFLGLVLAAYHKKRDNQFYFSFIVLIFHIKIDSFLQGGSKHLNNLKINCSKSIKLKCLSWSLWQFIILIMPSMTLRKTYRTLIAFKMLTNWIAFTVKQPLTNEWAQDMFRCIRLTLSFSIVQFDSTFNLFCSDLHWHNVKFGCDLKITGKKRVESNKNESTTCSHRFVLAEILINIHDSAAEALVSERPTQISS